MTIVGPTFLFFASREVLVQGSFRLAELALGHLHYHLTDVPPQEKLPEKGPSIKMKREFVFTGGRCVKFFQ